MPIYTNILTIVGFEEKLKEGKRVLLCSRTEDLFLASLLRPFEAGVGVSITKQIGLDISISKKYHAR
jgi:hypothetical protein